MNRTGRWCRLSWILVLAALSACGPGLDEGGGSAVSGGQEVPEGVDPVLAQEFQAILQNFIAGPCDAIPLPAGNEMHDCQRLINIASNRRAFGPLVGVIPHFLNVAQDSSFYTTPQVSAWIANAGPDPYDTLGIASGTPSDPMVHCLWLHDDAGTWRAALTNIGAGSFNCGAAPAAGDPVWASLAVVRQHYGGAGLADYPNTARWQWTGPINQADGEQYIGIKCGTAWCAVGRSGFTPRPIPAPGSGMTRERAIPGWHDAQFLAVLFPPGAPSARLTPGPWGVVYPDPVGPSPDWSQFRRVASYDLQAASGAAGGIGVYMQKLNLAAANNRSEAWLELRHAPSPADPPEARYVNSLGGTPKAPQGPIVTSPTRHGVVGSARWRWNDTFDETTWVPCAWGCCNVRETA